MFKNKGTFSIELWVFPKYDREDHAFKSVINLNFVKNQTHQNFGLRFCTILFNLKTKLHFSRLQL